MLSVLQPTVSLQSFPSHFCIADSEQSAISLHLSSDDEDSMLDGDLLLKQLDKLRQTVVTTHEKASRVVCGLIGESSL